MVLVCVCNDGWMDDWQAIGRCLYVSVMMDVMSSKTSITGHVS